MPKTKLQITKKFFKPNIFWDSPLVFKSRDMNIVKTRLNLLADIYEKIHENLSDYNEYKISSSDLDFIIEECMNQICIFDIDDILYTCNRSFVNGAKQFMKKSHKFLAGGMSLDNYMYFIDMMYSYYTYVYLDLCGHEYYNF